MPCCCRKVLNLCNVRVCGVLEISQTAESEIGTENIYSLILDFLDTVITILGEQVAGENILFDVSKLNENYEYTGQVFDSLGNLVSITQNGETYDCIKFKTVLSTTAVSVVSTPPILNIVNTVVVEAVIGEEPVVTGTTELVLGLTEGSNTIVSNAFIGVRLIIIRGNIPIPGIDPGDGSNYFTKDLSSDFATLSKPFVLGEFIRIQTIPQ